MTPTQRRMQSIVDMVDSPNVTLGRVGLIRIDYRAPETGDTLKRQVQDAAKALGMEIQCYSPIQLIYGGDLTVYVGLT